MKIFVNIIFVETMQLRKLRKFCTTKIWSHTVFGITDISVSRFLFVGPKYSIVALLMPR